MNHAHIVQEPVERKAISFIDGQNLYHCAKEAFGYDEPNYDPKKLHDAVCAQKGWKPAAVRFYTGVPSPKRKPRYHQFWHRKLLAMSRAGIHTTYLPFRYAYDDESGRYVGREKGIDVRLAPDVVRLARQQKFDVAILFSQDQD